VENTGVVKLGTTGSIATDSVVTNVTGINSLGDFIWRDLDRDGVQDGGADETGIANISVNLYYTAAHHDLWEGLLKVAAASRPDLEDSRRDASATVWSETRQPLLPPSRFPQNFERARIRHQRQRDPRCRRAALRHRPDHWQRALFIRQSAG
jgi:hypothetical protein